jgi:hypothetical protein
MFFLRYDSAFSISRGLKRKMVVEVWNTHSQPILTRRPIIRFDDVVYCLTENRTQYLPNMAGIGQHTTKAWRSTRHSRLVITGFKSERVLHVGQPAAVILKVLHFCHTFYFRVLYETENTTINVLYKVRK